MVDDCGGWKTCQPLQFPTRFYKDRRHVAIGRMYVSWFVCRVFGKVNSETGLFVGTFSVPYSLSAKRCRSKN